MYAIVSIAGQQFKVEKGKKVFVHRLPGNIGDEVSFDQVLLISQDEKINIGAPYLPEAVVSAQILSHNRGDKVLVFKKKRRKSYQKLTGHRQDFTQILIENISESGAPVKTEKKKTAAPKPEVAAADASAEVLKEEVTVARDTAKKPAAKAKAEEKPKKAAAKKAPAAKTEAKPAAKKAPAKGKGESKAK